MATYTYNAVPPGQYQSPFWTSILKLETGGFAGTDIVKLVTGHNTGFTPEGKPHIWSLEWMQMVLTTDANAGNRNPWAYIYDASANIYLKFTFGAVAASQSLVRNGIYPISHNNAAYPSTEWIGSHPDTFQIMGDDYWYFRINGGKAGDSWTVMIRLKYQNYLLGMHPPSTPGVVIPPPPPPSAFPPARFD